MFYFNTKLVYCYERLEKISKQQRSSANLNPLPKSEESNQLNELRHKPEIS